MVMRVCASEDGCDELERGLVELVQGNWVRRTKKIIEKDNTAGSWVYKRCPSNLNISAKPQKVALKIQT